MESQKVQSKTIQHLTKYRFGGRTVEFIGNNAAPYVQVTLEMAGEPINNVVKSLDESSNKILTSVDSALPEFFFRTPSKDNVVASTIDTTVDASTSTAVAANESKTSVVAPAVEEPECVSFYETHLHTPVHNMAMTVRKQYSAIYDTHGKALIRSSLDPLVLPINTQLESFIETNFPKSVKVGKTGYSSEISRTFRILRSGVLSLFHASTPLPLRSSEASSEAISNAVASEEPIKA